MVKESLFLSLFKDVKDKIVFQDSVTGFSMLRPYRKRPGYVSLMKVYIDPKVSNTGKDIQQVIVTVSYGKYNQEDKSISMHLLENEKHNEPIDIVSKDYVYDSKNKRILKKKAPVSGSQLVEDMFRLHLKPTRMLSGAYVRLKLTFQRRVVPFILGVVIDLLTYSLYFLTGDRYKYSFFYGEETESIRSSEDVKQEDNTGKRFKVFDYEASLRVIVVYSLLHLLVYILSETLHWHIPDLIKSIFTNTFLTALYAIVSLAFLDVTVPKVLKNSIKVLSRLTSWFETRAIKV